MIDRSLLGKTCLITGTARGMGRLAVLERPGVHEFLGERDANRAAALSLLLCGAASLPGAAERRLVLSLIHI